MTTASETIARTTHGLVQGFEKAGLLNFRGVAYAQPPVGQLRFRAPEPALPWPGMRDATDFGPSSLQTPVTGDIPLPSAPARRMSEDCLYLNIITPGLGGLRPVVVWIHGGGFTTGAGADFSGRHLAARGVVVVAINYRLGAFGFLGLRSLADEQGRYTNFGLRDQIAALQWVRDNIANFGGDPANVTIFGESAGGSSVGCLLGSPEARGLFHKAIAQSGAGHSARTAATAVAAGERFCELLGVLPDDSSSLRAADAEAILAASSAYEDEFQMAALRRRRPLALAHAPVIDGQCLPDLPIDTFRKGEGSAVPVMAGWTADEFKLFEPMWESGPPSATEVEALFAESWPDGARIHRAYLQARSARGDSMVPNDVWSAALTDSGFRVPADRLLEANAAAGRPTYGYVFTWRSPASGGALGACHSLDVFFVSGTHVLVPGFAGGGPAADVLSATMMDAWVAFATKGDPSTPSLPWPKFDPTTRRLAELGEACCPIDGWQEQERKTWDGVIP